MSQFEDEPRKCLDRRWLAALIVAAVGLHVVPFATYPPGDVYYYVLPWYRHILEAGPVDAFSVPFSNYTPPYLYLLAAMTAFDGILHPALLVKLLSIAGAFWIAFAASSLLKALRAPSELALATLLLPSIVLNASLLGQADTFWVAPCIFAVAAAIRKKHVQVALWSGLAFAFKSQAVFFAPFVVWLFASRRVAWWVWLLAPAVYGVAMLPAWFAGWPAWDLATIYWRQVFEPELTDFVSNGASWWTLFSWLAYDVALRNFWFGFVTTIAAIFLYWRYLPAPSSRLLLLAAALSAAMVPFLLPSMHERFYMLADVLAFLYAVAFPSRRSIFAAGSMQIASALPVLVWAYRLQPLQLVAPPLALAAIILMILELAALRGREIEEKPRAGEHILGTA